MADTEQWPSPALLCVRGRSCDEERTFLRGMLERQTEQGKLLTDERQQKERHSPTLLARLFRRSA